MISLFTCNTDQYFEAVYGSFRVVSVEVLLIVGRFRWSFRVVPRGFSCFREVSVQTSTALDVCCMIQTYHIVIVLYSRRELTGNASLHLA